MQWGAVTRKEFDDLAEQRWEMGRKDRRMNLVKLVYDTQKYASRRHDLSGLYITIISLYQW